MTKKRHGDEVTEEWESPDAPEGEASTEAPDEESVEEQNKAAEARVAKEAKEVEEKAAEEVKAADEEVKAKADEEVKAVEAITEALNEQLGPERAQRVLRSAVSGMQDPVVGEMYSAATNSGAISGRVVSIVLTLDTEQGRRALTRAPGDIWVA